MSQSLRVPQGPGYIRDAADKLIKIDPPEGAIIRPTRSWDVVCVWHNDIHDHHKDKLYHVAPGCGGQVIRPGVIGEGDKKRVLKLRCLGNNGKSCSSQWADCEVYPLPPIS